MKIISVLGFLVILFTNVLFASPGDSVDVTIRDVQNAGVFGQRLYVDSLDQFHFIYCRNQQWIWNFRDTNGVYIGGWGYTPFTGGGVNIDVTRDAEPHWQRSAVGYHFNTGSNGYFPFFDIDVYNGSGSWPNDPRTPGHNNWLWPYVACVNNGNIIMAMDDNAGSYHHVVTTTDMGTTWINELTYDSSAIITRFLRSSNNHGSNRVVFVRTQFITDSAAAGQLDQDLYYTLSTDGGVTWGQQTNITGYLPTDSVRGYVGLSAVFDLNDKLHIVWEGRHVDNGQYLDESKIFHWDEVTNTISVVSGPNPLFPGGWWGWSTHEFGVWRLPADEPQLIIDRSTGWLYCLWHGQTDTTDHSFSGWPNGDFYGAYSTDGGLTWGAYGSAYGYVNLTNTHTSGGLPGFCEDEDYMTANPFTFHDSIVVTYIEDKDAGSFIYSEGDTTNNPVRIWVFHKSLISGPSTIGENKVVKPNRLFMNISPIPASDQVEISFFIPGPGNVSLKLYSLDGRFVKDIESGYKKAGAYRIFISTHGLTNGNYFIVLSAGNGKIRRNIIVVH